MPNALFPSLLYNFFLKEETAQIYSTRIIKDPEFTEQPNKKSHQKDEHWRKQWWCGTLKYGIQVLVLESLSHEEPRKTRKATEINLTLWGNIRQSWRVELGKSGHPCDPRSPEEKQRPRRPRLWLASQRAQSEKPRRGLYNKILDFIHC